MITQEDLRNFAIDLEDKDYIVSYGSLPDHKAYRYDDREQFRFSISKNFKKSGKAGFSINDYSEILENIEELHDRIDEEYKLLKIYFRTTGAEMEFKSVPDKQEIVSVISNCYSEKNKILNKRYRTLGELQISKDILPTPSEDDSIIQFIDFTFKCRKYEKDQSDKNLKNLYKSLEDKDGEIKKKMKDLFTDVKFEGIKRFKEL